MNENDFRELRQLKEQKDAEQLRMQDLEDLGLTDLVDLSDTETDGETPSDEETVTFHSVTPQAPARDLLPRTERKIRSAQKRKKTKKILRITLLSTASVAAVLAILFGILFAVRSANRKKANYCYWGSGLFLDQESAAKHYSFFGNLLDLTVYDEIGQVAATAEFDEDGHCVKETRYDASGNAADCYVHSYENGIRVKTVYYAQGQMAELSLYEMQTQTSVRADRTYPLQDNYKELSFLSLDQNGNAESETFYQNDIPVRRVRYRGALVEENTILSENGTAQERTIYEYNARGDLQTEIIYDADTSIRLRTVYQYNESNLLTKKISYDGNGEILSYYTYNYDSAQNPVKQVLYDAEGQIKEQILRSFNDKNRVSKETSMTADGTITDCTGYEYTEQGYVYRLIAYDPVYTTQIAAYTVYLRDSAGNITETNSYNAAQVMISKQIFNAAGYVVEDCTYSDTGVLRHQVKNRYDEAENLTQNELYSFTQDGDPRGYTITQFDDRHRAVVVTEEDFVNKTYDQSVFTFNDDDTVAEIAHYDRNGVILSEETYRDERMISFTSYENGKEKEAVEYHYDSDGKVLYILTVNLRTNQASTVTYHYSANGSLLSAVTTDASDRPVLREEYDAVGNRIRATSYDESGNVDQTHEYEYDGRLRVIVDRLYDKDGAYQKRTVYYYRDVGDPDYRIYDAEGNLLYDSTRPDYDPNAPTEP